MKRMLHLLLYLCPCWLSGQTFALEQKVTFEYINYALEEVLEDLSKNYRIYFSYSKDFVAIDREVSWKARNKPLGKAIQQLFSGLGIEHKVIGNQILLKQGLKVNPPPAKRLVPKQRKKQNEKYGQQELESKKLDLPEPLTLKSYGMNGVAPPDADYLTVAQAGFILPPKRSEPLKSLDDTRIVQVSLFPSIGTNLDKSDEITNNMSVNIFWGNNGGVNGLEVGGFINTVEEDVKGVQIAGLANWVNGDVGSSDWIDEEEKMLGVQIAGLFNSADNVRAVQVAGLANFTKAGFSGVQTAGLGNYVGADAKGVQVAGLFNINEGGAGSQVSGLVNAAEDVEGFQIAGLFNKGKHVKGFQLGLVNVSDSIDGTSFGLINLVKGGSNSYNHWEVSGNELLHLNVSWIMGTPTFYNLFHLGTHFGRGIDGWGIGYGLGTAQKWTSRSTTNIELSAIHINEGSIITRDLNLLLNLKILLNRRIGRNQSFFFGPTLNVMLSKLSDPEQNTYGSQLVPYTIFSGRFSGNEATRILNWVGFSVGFRF
ncbi:MAG: STN domain-containing protein [Bacteroidota bacterium]